MSAFTIVTTSATEGSEAAEVSTLTDEFVDASREVAMELGPMRIHGRAGLPMPATPSMPGLPAPCPPRADTSTAATGAAA